MTPMARERRNARHIVAKEYKRRGFMNPERKARDLVEIARKQAIARKQEK